MTRQPIARLIDIVKSYGDTLALDRASVDLFPGEVLGLVGPNGSGKSTLTGILCGSISPDGGVIEVHGKTVTFDSPAAAMACGIRNLPQSLEIYPALTVLENIFIGQEIVRWRSLFRRMDWTKMQAASADLLRRVGADQIDPRQLVSQLSGGQQKSVVLARLLATHAPILVFDEPASSLGVRQKLKLLDLLAAEAARGHSVVFISHDIEDVLAICTRVMVLRRGQTVTTAATANMDRDTLSSQMAVA